MYYFVVDSMHGKLCRWLRILGHDAEYVRGGDDEVLRLALYEGRILITADVRLFREAVKRGAEALLVRENELPLMLLEVASYMRETHNVTIEDFVKATPRRCSVCNGVLRESGSERFTCKECGKEYWKGSHWEGITRTINEVLRLAGRLGKTSA